MRLGAAFQCLMLSLLILLPGATSSQTPAGRDVVTASAYSSFEPVGRDHEFQLAVVLKIRPGFHINAREKSEDYLIATDLQADLPRGFKAGAVSYPKGTLQKFAFSKASLNVYQGTITLRMPVTSLPDAALGRQRIPLKLRFQACNNELCLPPVTLNFDASVTVTAAASEAKPANQELFPQKQK